MSLQKDIAPHLVDLLRLMGRITVGKYTIDTDVRVDVEKGVDIYDDCLTEEGELPVCFGKVQGDFTYTGKGLVSSNRLPSFVGGKLLMRGGERSTIGISELNLPYVKGTVGLRSFSRLIWIGSPRLVSPDFHDCLLPTEVYINHCTGVERIDERMMRDRKILEIAVEAGLVSEIERLYPVLYRARKNIIRSHSIGI